MEIREEGEAKGKAKKARRILSLLGRDQFGEPSAKVQATLDSLTDLSRLEKLTVRLRHAESWQNLLGTPATWRRSSRRKPPT